jgi:hypothetical protein
MFSRAVIDPSSLVTEVIDAFWQGIQPK